MTAVSSGVEAVLIFNLIEGCLELTRVRVNGELVHDRVIHHERQSVNEAFLGDGFSLRDAWNGYAIDGVFLRSLIDGVVLGTASGNKEQAEGAHSCSKEYFSHFCHFVLAIGLR